MSARTNEATICTVSTPFHKRLLHYNYELTKRLNPAHQTSWVIVNNPEIHISRQRIRQLLDEQGIAHNHKTYRRMLYKEQRRYHDSTKMHRYIGGEQIVGGLSLADVMAKLPQTSPVKGETQEQFDYRKDKVLQSYHHAYNLELALKQVKTRFAILLDPDLYVVRPGWLLDMVAHMHSQKLAVFGVPWNPRYFQKFRYFPATHFMVIDLKKIPQKEINLLPDLLTLHSNFEPKFWSEYSSLKGTREHLTWSQLFTHLRAGISEDIRQRRLIGQSRDSGYRLFESCRQKPHLKVETASPVFTSSDGFVPPTVSAQQREFRIWDRFSYLPKRNGYLAPKDFKEFGYPDFRGLGWEEFLWKDEPFAFHIRGEVHRARVGNVQQSQLLDGLNAVLSRHGYDRIAAWSTEAAVTPTQGV